MALNPAYAQQSTRKLPFSLGYVYGTGDQAMQIAGFDGTVEACYVLGDGEWDGPVVFSPITSVSTGIPPSGWPFQPIPPLTDAVPSLGAGATEATLLANYLHFHSGSFSPKGVPRNLVSNGPDQGSDSFYTYFPSVTPALNLSGLAYYFVRVLSVAGPLSPYIPFGDLAPVGIWRSTRCRMFDANGDVIGYGFTTNPTWQMIETLLRFQIKPQQPPLAGLTNFEKSLFDWPAMVAHATRNATYLASGAPRFCGNFMFAADAKLGAMMETQLRNCRSFKRERAGVISFVGDDARASVFIASQKAVVPGSIKLAAKDMKGVPNIYVPQYRELNIPAVAAIATVASGVTYPEGLLSTFTTVGNQPFFSEDAFAYDGGADPGDFLGHYQVAFYDDSSTGQQTAPPIANSFLAQGGPQTPKATTGGFVGTEQSRFKQYAPTCVQHRAAQQAFNQVAPGLTPFPRALKVFYDLGNNTFDQTNRIMQWMRTRDLGPDVTPYVPPIVGSISVYAENVDVNGDCAGEVESGDVITLDPTADPVFAGEYVVGPPVTDNLVNAQQGGKSSVRDFLLQTYQPTAFTDISMPPGESYQTLTPLAYSMADLPLANYYYFMEGTPTGGLATDGTATIGLPDLSVWWVGQPAPTLYSGIQVAEVPVGSHVILYLQLSSFGGAAPVLSCDSVAAVPPIPLASGQIVIFCGTIAAGSLSGTGTRPVAHITGGSGLAAATLSPDTGYYGGTALPGPAAPPTE